MATKTIETMSNKIQYWINQDGEQTGPLTLDQLELMTLNEKTYVWSAGYDDWKPLTEVPELTHLLPALTAAVPTVPVNDENVSSEPADEPMMSQPAHVATQPSSSTGQPYPACPPTNMVWAIISTLLCCVPLGVVAIIYANKVSKKYYEGDFAAAEHYSEVSAWWCIGTIVGGIALQPLVSLVQMMMMG